MVAQLYYRHFYTQLCEVFGRFEPDRPAADYRRSPDALFPDIFSDPNGIGYAPESKYPFGIDPGNVRPEREGTCGYDQFIVAFRIFFARRDLHDLRLFALPVDGSHFAADTDIDIVLLSELLRSPDHQCIHIFYQFFVQKIRQAAGGIRDVRPLFEHYDLSLFIQPSEPGRRSRSTSHSADYDHLHLRSLLCFLCLYNLII